MRNDVTRTNSVSERTKSFREFDFLDFAVWTKVKRKMRVRRRNKKKHENRNLASQLHQKIRTRSKNRSLGNYFFCFRALSLSLSTTVENHSKLSFCFFSADRSEQFFPRAAFDLLENTSCNIEVIDFFKGQLLLLFSRENRQRPNITEFLWIV